MNTDLPKRRNIISRFFRFLWRSLKVLNTILFGLVAVFLISTVIFVAVKEVGPKVPQGSALILDPAGTLVEQQSIAGAAALLQSDDLPQQALVKDITDALALAKEDTKIKLVVLELDKLEQGLMPKLETIVAAINDFKTSGKKVIAVANTYSQSALFLAAHADEVLLNPEGAAVPTGFAMYSPFFKSFLQKHDVTVNVFKVGRYKSAVDPFTRDDMSPEDREARLGILDTWWDAYTTGIETARGMAAGSIDAMLQNAPEQIELAQGNIAQLSLNKGFVDRLVTDSERRSYLIEQTGGRLDDNGSGMGFRGITYKKYLRSARLPTKPEADKVAVITAVGNIIDGTAPPGGIGGETLTKLIRKARLDDDVKAIVLRIDSPGGSKSASEMIRTELQAAQASGIPLVASMGSFAASGGYWIASSADEIWASPTTITGSIGIFGLLLSFEKTLARYDIYSDGVTTTPLAGGASAMRGVTPAMGDVLQTIIDAGYQQFLNTVAEGRGMDVGAVHDVAQGRIWTGQKAQQLGLVDELGDLKQAISAAASLANLEDYSVWNVQTELTAEQKVMRMISETAYSKFPQTKNAAIAQMTGMIRKEFGFLERLNDPRHVYVICTDCPLFH